MPAIPSSITRPRLALLTLVVLGLLLSGCDAFGSGRDRGGDGTALATLLTAAVGDQGFTVFAGTPEDLDLNIDTAHKALLRTIVERHGRTLANARIATAVGPDSAAYTAVFAVGVDGIPATELLPIWLLQPDPSEPPLPSPRAETIAGHPVLWLAPAEDEKPVLLLRGDIVFTIIAPDRSSLEMLVRAVWDVADPAALRTADPAA